MWLVLQHCKIHFLHIEIFVILWELLLRVVGRGMRKKECSEAHRWSLYLFLGCNRLYFCPVYSESTCLAASKLCHCSVGCCWFPHYSIGSCFEITKLKQIFYSDIFQKLHFNPDRSNCIASSLVNDNIHELHLFSNTKSFYYNPVFISNAIISNVINSTIFHCCIKQIRSINTST